MIINIIGQIIGFVAMALMMLSFQIKKPKFMLTAQCAAQVCFTVHFFMIGSVSGAVQNLISAIRGVGLISNVKAFRSNASKYVFICLYMISPVVMFVLLPHEGSGLLANAPDWVILTVDFLPAVAMAINTYYIWTLDARKHRMSQLYAASPMWITYNILNASYSGIITEIFNAVSSLIFLLRTGGFKKNKNAGKSEGESK